MAIEPFLVTLGASNHSPVRGCPGVPKTCPRVESVLEIRTKTGSSFVIKTIILELNTIQSVTLPANGGLSSNDSVRAYNIYKNHLFKSPPSKNDNILGIDLPFIIPLNKDIISSGKNIRWNAKTVHNLTVRIGWMNASKLESYLVSFPLVIKRYDTLPLYRQFNEPITKTIDSPDKNILVEYSLPNTSVGPRDELYIYLKIFPNSNFVDKDPSTRRAIFKKKTPAFKLKKISFELREVVESEGVTKLVKLLNKLQEFEAVLGADGVTTQTLFDFPSDIKSIIANSTTVRKLPTSIDLVDRKKNFLSSRRSMDKSRSLDKRRSLDLPLHGTLSNESRSSLDIHPVPTQQPATVYTSKTLTTNTKLLDEINNGVPLTHMQGFTTNGKLYSVRYELTFKIKINNCPLIKFSQLITVAPYNRIQSVKLLKWIVKEWDMAQFINNTTFQTNFNNEKVKLINNYTNQQQDTSDPDVDANFRASVNLSKRSVTEPNNFSKFASTKAFVGTNNYYYDYGVGTLKDPMDDVDPYALTVYQSKPFHVYRPQNKLDWKLLGMSEKLGKAAVNYID